MAAPLILAPAGPVLSPSERDFFRAADPWGFIVFARNLETARQIRDLTADLRDAVGRDAPVLIDQEGGRVQRLRPPLARDWLPPLDDVARLGPRAARGLYLRARIIAAELHDLGIDVNCTPTLDIATPDTHPFLRNRCFGDTLAQVVTMGQAVAGGLLDGGVLPVIKHMPGHGRGRVDSHHDLPRSETDADTLRRTDFAAFAALADLPLGMSAHMIYTAFDAERPATQSPAMIGVIRDGIGFDGLLMTDDISMNALAGDVVARASAALDAGCEIVLHCNGDLAEMSALAEVCGAMSAAARKRATRALAMRVTPAPDRIEALIAEYDAL